MNRLFFLLVLPLCSAVAMSATVYKTRDDNGVVSYSDQPPAEGEQAEVLKIDASTPQSPDEYLERLDDMRETTDRMAADRREREKHRAELREIQARKESYQESSQQGYTGYNDYVPVYSGSYRHRGRPPYRPGYRPRPVHPIARPPLRHPGTSHSTNAQLMRPMVSTRP